MSSLRRYRIHPYTPHPAVAACGAARQRGWGGSLDEFDCWGNDDYSQITDAPTDIGYTAVSAGLEHTCALDATGAVECWGNNAYSQVSDAPSGSGYTHLSAGHYHNCVVDSSESLECWGLDDDGQVSDIP